MVFDITNALVVLEWEGYYCFITTITKFYNIKYKSLTFSFKYNNLKYNMIFYKTKSKAQNCNTWWNPAIKYAQDKLVKGSRKHWI